MSVRWKNSLGEDVNLDDIDKVYALNIFSMVLIRRGRWEWTREEVEADPLVEKLRDVVLNGREPNADDHERAEQYNALNSTVGLPYRAPA